MKTLGSAQKTGKEHENDPKGDLGKLDAFFKSARNAKMCDTHESNKNSRSPENTPPFWQPPRLDGSL